MAEQIVKSLTKIKGFIFNKYQQQGQIGFVDCCTKYSFIRIFDTINYNNRINRLGIADLVLNEDYNFTQILEHEIVNPILSKSNNIFGIIGKTGSGKSELGQVISLIAIKTNETYLNRNVQFHLCYTWEDFHNALEQLKKGDVLLKDEMPRTIGKGSRIQRWQIDNVLHSIRKLENTIIFIDPVFINVNLCDLYLESAGMDQKSRTNRFMLLDEKKQYFGHIYTKLHEDWWFRATYEAKKDEFIKKAIKQAGSFEASEDHKKKEQEEFDEELEEKLEFLESNLKPKNKDRDIHIWKLRQQEYEYKKIANIVGLNEETVKGICSRINKLLK